MLQSLSGAWVVIFFISLLFGLFWSSFSYTYYKGPCDKPMAKIEYVMPGFQVGCWLGRPWSEDENTK